MRILSMILGLVALTLIVGVLLIPFVGAVGMQFGRVMR